MSLRKLEKGNFQIVLHHNHLSLTKEFESSIDLNPNEVSSLISALRLIQTFEKGSFRPEEINYGPFTIKFKTLKYMVLQKNSEESNSPRLPFTWDDIDDMANIVRDGLQKYLDEQRFRRNRRTVVNTQYVNDQGGGENVF